MQKYTLITLLLSVFIALLGIGIIVPVMPIFARDLGAGGFALGVIIAAFSVTRGLLQPVVGNLSDRWGRKGFLMAGLLIYGLVGLLIPMAKDVSHLVVIRAFHGVGSAMIVPIGMAYMSLLAPIGQESRYMSYLNVAIFCGIGCGPVIGGILSDIWGLASVFYTMASLSLVALMLVILYMPRRPAGEVATEGNFLKSLVEMVHNRKTVGILIARYSTMIIMVPSMAFVPLLMSEWPGVTGLQIGFVIACRTLVNALLQVPFGKLADKYSKRKILISSSLVLSAVVYCIPFFTTVTFMAVVYLLLGCVEAAIWAVLGGYASLEAKAHYGHGTMMGMFGFAMSGGVFTGAVLAGGIMDQWGIAAAYHVTGVTVLLLSLFAFVMIAGAEKNGSAKESGT
ncbi:MFS transporter [Desulforhopalus sp. IMCC35007]|uniref:MFS transporter n=1 Tax=Desulforhopalus sp. IMCC35007 TaxID=2569543 RepID=UPI0010ADF70E|nr:MFS transporter [Desulforhopalus sp. IMCC35007]TKB06717.1 MFS transporter [Desulforhopalus sp. IMCC35007]